MARAVLLIVVLAVLAAFCVWPQMDLAVSALFYSPEKGFAAQQMWPFRFLHATAYDGARVLGLALVAGAVLAWRKPFLALPRKAWLFLFLGLLLGPGLVGNVILKDHWGRARPHQITEFGGNAHFTPPLVLSNACNENCSFVSGDGAFGFYFPIFAYVVAPRRSRRVFWGGMALGALFGGARIAMGAHFLSDVLYAAVFMLLTSAILHGVMYGPRQTLEAWKRWGCRSET